MTLDEASAAYEAAKAADRADRTPETMAAVTAAWNSLRRPGTAPKGHRIRQPRGKAAARPACHARSALGAYGPASLIPAPLKDCTTMPVIIWTRNPAGQRTATYTVEDEDGEARYWRITEVDADLPTARSTEKLSEIGGLTGGWEGYTDPTSVRYFDEIEGALDHIGPGGGVRWSIA